MPKQSDNISNFKGKSNWAFHGLNYFCIMKEKKLLNNNSKYSKKNSMSCKCCMINSISYRNYQANTDKNDKDDWNSLYTETSITDYA